VADGTPRILDNPIGLGMVGWHRGQCGAVEITSGECPSNRGEAMVSARMADQFDIALGDTVGLGISANAAADQVEVVGTYDAATAEPRERASRRCSGSLPG
jgi:predicted lysophospholipase L1 biosynthesis ABC-type transport system permease subunit